MSYPMQRRGIRHGFTMIELLTVIGIICILMAILVPVISKIRQQAQIVDTTHFLTKISTACQNYFAEYRSYPGPVPDNAVHGFNKDLSTDTPNTASAGFAAAFGNANPAVYNSVAGVETPTSSPALAFRDVTSSQNLILGLLGGLTTMSGSGAVIYDNTLVGRGPQVLNVMAAQQLPPYLDVGKYDLTSDGAGNYSSGILTSGPNVPSPGTYVIPEFIDHFSQPNPIIYLRARAGAFSACDQPILASTSTGALANLGSQYYSAEMAPYAPQFFNQADRYNNFQTQYPIYVASTGGTGGYGLNFFGSQALNNINSSTASNTTARGQDSFILISAGYDGLFGTKDDIVIPSN